mgnify:CR=1 FL=1
MSAVARARVREFLADSLTPLGVYRRLAEISPVRFLFESVTGGEQVSRYSFLGAGPREIYRLYPDRLEVERGGERSALAGNPLERLRGALQGISATAGPIPFTGGYVGFFGYDLVRMLESLPGAAADPFALPVAMLARFDNLVVFDHAHQKVLAISNQIEGEVSAAEAEDHLAELSALLSGQAGVGAVELPTGDAGDLQGAISDFDGGRYRQAVRQAQEYIAAGDIFQVVLARRWQLGAAVEPFALYRALRMVNPSPYMVLLETPEVALVGASPEMLVRKQGSRIETRPIAGTRPRGHDAEEDRRLAKELLADEKERAEHVMLVDLGRNDVGRVARAGSVRLSEFMGVERYSHVMHLVSSVEGDLATGRDALDALLACFPAGTVSGAPKVRAMEIIDELEVEARGPYAGAVGYLSFTGDLDTCITIRTLVVQQQEISVTAGAGIVADSTPEREERETESKAAALLAAVDLARRIHFDPDGG